MLTEEELVADLTEEERSLCEAWCLSFSEKLTRIFEEWNKEMEERYRGLSKIFEEWNKEMEERKKER